MTQSLIKKYNIAGPRYTSYPTVPYWTEDTFSLERWKSSVRQTFSESNTDEGISIYIHLPFCEQLCTFCACHKQVTENHTLEAPYIDAVLKEWSLYLKLFDDTPIIKELHMGGGTPTFFSTESLTRLLTGIFNTATLSEQAELSFEGHPNSTTEAHLQTLYDMGFRRVSYGVQDYAENVQIAINRIQSFESVKTVTDTARQIGYESVSHDLVFGLPFQTRENITTLIEKTNILRPDRISFYSYAHVPWIKGVAQRKFDENDLPKDEEKRELYELGKSMFADMGYEEIGMDHFSLTSDALYQASVNKTLHRNFMGYTPQKTQLMVGLGMSSISDSWYGFSQNVKTTKTYQDTVNAGEIPVFRGHILSKEDLVVRKHILNLMCQFKTSWATPDAYFDELPQALAMLTEMQKDGLIDIQSDNLVVHEHARPFIRNVCMAFDRRLQRNKPDTKLFSMTI